MNIRYEAAMDSWQRDTFVEDGGWVTFASMEDPIDGAAEICADQLASVELPAVAAVGAEEAGVEVEVAN